MNKAEYRQGQLFGGSDAPKIERRYFTGVVETRKEGENRFSHYGLASRTGAEYTMYEDSNEVWVEEIAPEAFRDVLNDDVRVLINHEPNLILGRTTAGTAEIRVGANGLEYEWSNDDEISYAKDLSRSIERGDVTQSSFGFYSEYKNSTFKEMPMPDGRRKYKRTINKIDRLFDVSPVTFPASNLTEAGQKRDFENALNEYRKAQEESREAEVQAPTPEANTLTIYEAQTRLNSLVAKSF